MNQFVLFGASGDLAKVKLYPALYSLYQSGVKCRYIGFGRTSISDSDFRELVKSSAESDDDFSNEFSYISGKYDKSGLADLRASIDSNLPAIYYLALPTRIEVLAPLFDGLIANDLVNENSRFVIEKPFGSDLNSAEELMDLLRSKLGEEKVFLIDHYLAKDLVRDLITLRFANPIFESVWNNNFIDSVKIETSESVGIEGRGEYYDKTGAIRDMLQNHVLQILAIVTMDQPESFSFNDFKKEKLSILKNVRIFSSDFEKNIEIGQYEGYKNESDVDKDSLTETFAKLIVEVDNDRWRGVPLSISTGKKLQEKHTEITITFKGMQDCLWEGKCDRLARNQLIINIYPKNDIRFTINSEFRPTEKLPEPLDLRFSFTENKETIQSLPYANALKDIHNQDKTYTPSFDEIIASWKFTDEVMKYLELSRKNILKIY